MARKTSWSDKEISILLSGKNPEGRTEKACEIRRSVIRCKMRREAEAKKQQRLAIPTVQDEITEDVKQHTIIPVTAEVDDNPDQLTIPGIPTRAQMPKPKLGKYIVTLYKGGHRVSEIARVFNLEPSKVQSVIDMADMFI